MQEELLSVSRKGFVRVVPEVALDRCFDYSIPGHFEKALSLGMRLRVPWGKKSALAYVVAFPDEPEVERTRDILEVLGEEPLVPAPLVELARWIANYYCCEFPLALKGVLPDVVRSKESGYKEQFWVRVPEDLKAEVVHVALTRARSQKNAWQYAYKIGGGWLSELIRETGAGASVWKGLAERGFVVLEKEKVERNPFDGAPVSSSALVLTDEQQAALEVILEEVAKEQPSPVLLQGVTGSGKTEVYLQAMDATLKRGKSALVLVPEISLTGQTVERFRSRFEKEEVKVAVLHSHLSAGERHDQWQNIRQGKARIVIGARSAIFAPLDGLGLIVVDEEHESSYKQEEAPHYHARDVAVVRGHLEKVPVVLGSATPSLESVYNVQNGKYRLAKLNRRVESFELPTMHVVDLRLDAKGKGGKGKERGERRQEGGRIAISTRLREAVELRLQKGEQSILFLNRRGHSTSVQCPNCGHIMECPNCAVPMTYHRTNAHMVCHLCDYREEVSRKCVECGFDRLHYAGQGTQKVEDAVGREFPSARWQRMDSDSMRGKNAYERALGDFREGKTDILVGTQMISKGLHFPNVTCVGVVNCDAALQLPDFRAAERVFQQLVQVAGRAGRGEARGEVFLQTYTPFHPAIQFARHHDVDGFQEQEMEFRKECFYPPYCRIVLVTFRGKNEEKTLFCITQAAKKIAGRVDSIAEVPGPAPAPIPKLRNEFRYHLFIKTRNVLALSRVLKEEIRETRWPEGVRADVNVDAVSLL